MWFIIFRTQTLVTFSMTALENMRVANAQKSTKGKLKGPLLQRLPTNLKIVFLISFFFKLT